MTSSDGGYDIGTSLRKKINFLFVVRVLIIFAGSLSRGRIARILLLCSQSSLERSLFCSSSFPWCVRDFGRRQGSVFQMLVGELTNNSHLLLVSSCPARSRSPRRRSPVRRRSRSRSPGRRRHRSRSSSNSSR